ncbi:MAG: hypothetical protein GX107_04515 [Clostridiales bacterium]|jgi:hypothetical protein|nr:hypothetical protein [Clostridiales bacterium]
MLNLFNAYKAEGKIAQAVLVGQNLFNRNPQNHEVFVAYFDYLCALAGSLPSTADRQSFANQASVALAFFSESAELDEGLVEAISGYRQHLSVIINDLAVSEQSARNAALATAQAQNNDSLKKLIQLKDALHRAASQEQFDNALLAIGEADGRIEKDALTDAQSKVYDALTKEHTDLISEKMRELEFKKNTAYNRQAADAFTKAFKQFRANEGKYKNQTQLFSLASSTLFAYDPARLFNETLIYYNHVYSYIFGKLDDDGKLALTRFSIECERKLR